LIEVLDDFATPSYHRELLEYLGSNRVEWFYQDNIAKREGKPILGHQGFGHMLIHFDDPMPQTPLKSLILPLLFQIQDYLKSPKILRARLDMTMYNPNHLQHGTHVDMDGPHWSAVYYVNESDGDTIIGDTRVAPKPNRVVVFDGTIEHTGMSPAYHPNRIIINSNYDV
tara:strand:- start:171 stop:677 length:507 start_codon:yes stop_codon:yes gene_type:complete